MTAHVSQLSHPHSLALLSSSLLEQTSQKPSDELRFAEPHTCESAWQHFPVRTTSFCILSLASAAPLSLS